MSSNNSRFATRDLKRATDGGNPLVRETLHLLLIMDEGTETANRITRRNSLFDHFHGPFNTKTEAVFVSQKYLHFDKPIIYFLSARPMHSESLPDG